MAAAGRKTVIARYRRLRQIGIDHHGSALKLVSTDAIFRTARALGLAVGNTFFEDDLDFVDLAFDLLLYTSPRGRTRGIDRYAKAARLEPGSEEATVLNAMRNDRFSIWEVQRRHEVAGLIVRDTVDQEEGWLVDTGLERSIGQGNCFAARLVKPDDFMMTSGIIVPVIPELLEATLDEMPRSLQNASVREIVQHRRFATVLYRIALEVGILSLVAFQPIAADGTPSREGGRSRTSEQSSASKPTENHQLALRLNSKVA